MRQAAARLSAAIARTLDLLLAVMLAVLVASLAWQVFGRYVLDRAPAWSEELARFLMVWVTMLGAAAVMDVVGEHPQGRGLIRPRGAEHGRDHLPRRLFVGQIARERAPPLQARERGSAVVTSAEVTPYVRLVARLDLAIREVEQVVFPAFAVGGAHPGSSLAKSSKSASARCSRSSA